MQDKEKEKIFKALANKRRLAIIAFLKKRGVSNVGEIARHIKLSFKSTSRHLIVLESAGIFDKQQYGLEMRYRPSNVHHKIISAVLPLI